MSVAQDLLKKIEAQITSADLSEEFSKKGTILEIKDGVATVTGLAEVSFSEIVEFENGLKGLVLDLLKEYVGVLILGDYGTLAQGDTVKATGEVFSVGVGEGYLGRVVNGLGEAIDGLGDIKATTHYPVERIAP
jgi:F-type H+-transporting ATPase subunit alpha